MRIPFRTYLYLLFLLMLSSCQKDFNELLDSNQRYVEFTFNTDSLFAKYLYCYNGTYYFPQIDTLRPEFCLRITAYCYDYADQLLYSGNIFTSVHTEQKMRIMHLLKDETYRCVFLADIVEYDSQVDYLENWFQLGTDSWNSFYLFSTYRHDNAIYDVVGMSTVLVLPNNQSSEVSFTPITYNGYCVFTHTELVQSAHIVGFDSFRLQTLQGLLTSGGYGLDLSEIVGEYIRPVSMSNADKDIQIALVTETDTTLLNLVNANCRSFVATINCETKQIDHCDYY